MEVLSGPLTVFLFCFDFSCDLNFSGFSYFLIGYKNFSLNFFFQVNFIVHWGRAPYWMLHNGRLPMAGGTPVAIIPQPDDMDENSSPV